MGALALFGAIIGILVSPVFAMSNIIAYVSSESPPVWAPWVAPWERSGFLLDFASPPDVYRTYGRLYFMAMLPQLGGLYALWVLRQGGSTGIERWGLRLSFLGLVVALIGVFTDYWTGTPPSIGAEALGSLLLMVAYTLLGVGLWKSRATPRWSLIPLMGAVPGTVLGLFLLVFHMPSGPFMLSHVAWLLLGYCILTGKVRKGYVSTPRHRNHDGLNG